MARRKNNDGLSMLLALGLLVGLPLWLYEKMGGWLFVLLGAGVAAAIWYTRSSRTTGSPSGAAQPVRAPVQRRHQNSGGFNGDAGTAGPMDHKIDTASAMIFEAGMAHRAGDLYACRQHLKRAIYTLGTVKDRQQSPKLIAARYALKELVREFCTIDPWYQQVLPSLTRIIASEPGILQSELVKANDESLHDDIRMAIYFAELRGEIERVKSGRSFQLYLPGQPRLEPPPKKRSSRKNP